MTSRTAPTIFRFPIPSAHQDAALVQRLAAHLGFVDETNVFWRISLIRKCRRILKEEDRSSRAFDALSACLEMAA
jgi:hypothetical protein